MGISRAETAKRDKLIIAALERGTPPDVIARETGAGIASVYRKRQVWLQARSDKAVAGLYVGEDILDILDGAADHGRTERHSSPRPCGPSSGVRGGAEGDCAGTGSCEQKAGAVAGAVGVERLNEAQEAAPVDVCCGVVG